MVRRLFVAAHAIGHVRQLVGRISGLLLRHGHFIRVAAAIGVAEFARGVVVALVIHRMGGKCHY